MNRRLIRGLGLATGLLLALAGSAQAATDGDVVKFRQPYPLKDATRTVVQGHKVGVAASSDARPASCRMPKTSLYLAPRERAIELRQLSLDLRTCRAAFERGVPPKSARASAAQKPESAGSKQRGGDGAFGVQSLATGYRWGGFGRAWYRDLRTRRVESQVEAGADWNSNRGCIGTNNVFFRDSADKPLGWFEVSHRWGFINTACDSVVSSVSAHFRNRNFSGCSEGPVVDSYYGRVRFVGYPNGGIKGYRRSWNEPSCKDVLVAYFALYRR